MLCNACISRDILFQVSHFGGGGGIIFLLFLVLCMTFSRHRLILTKNVIVGLGFVLIVGGTLIFVGMMGWKSGERTINQNLVNSPLCPEALVVTGSAYTLSMLSMVLLLVAGCTVGLAAQADGAFGEIGGRQERHGRAVHSVGKSININISTVSGAVTAINGSNPI